MRKKKLLLVGAGNLCLQILKILGPKNAFEFVVLGRNEEATIRLCNLVALSCAQLGQFIAIKPVIADLTDIGRVTQLLREEAPDILVNCASLQSWRVITGLPKLSFEKLDQAQFGPWLPMHLTLMHCLMQAVKASGISAKTVNAAFPDAVNPILARVGLAPDIGVGNVANLINPEVVILGGYFVPLAPWILPAAEQALRDGTLAPAAGGCQLVASTLGHSAAAIGGAAGVLDGVDAGQLPVAAHR